ncbi:MAG TPA: translation elongation factor Ts [Myxococcota bacterium]|jgi:elongation factor Ts|nr:translation elongation factor Ts [Myxococcota bacterium]
MGTSATEVKELRERTGAGMMDCKVALTECGGDMEKAVDYLQKKGIAKAAKRAGKVASEGVVHAYVHAGGRIGVLVEVNSETDFVARSAEFTTMVHDIAMQICASNPLYITPDVIPAAELQRQKDIFAAQAAESGKPPAIAEKMAQGRLTKWYSEVCLVEQPFVKEPEKPVKELLTAMSAKTGEKIAVRRFVRFEVGEGIEKKASDLAAEVAAMVGEPKS